MRFFIFLLFISPAYAGESSTLAGQVAAVLLTLTFLFFGLYVFYRRKTGLQAGWHILGALSIGARERLVLVEIQGCQYLLGVTPGSITLIDKKQT